MPRELQNHYKISDLYPNAWPHSADADDDDDDLSDEEAGQNGGPVRQPSKNSNRQSKYQTLNRHASIRSAELGPDSLVQKDEPDPLGAAPSVAAELRKRGLPVDDTALRNKFLLSSTSFSPALFLSQVHQDASTEDLLRGLDYLGKSIEQKSASLKVLVESNFEKFVKAKATIDNVYAEMRTQGQEEPVSPRPSSGRPGGHTRGFSRSQPSSHFRTASGSTFSPTSAKSPGSAGMSDKRKNALTKESDYGTLGLRAPLQDLTIKAEEVWGPALGGREKEENVKMVLNALEVHKDIFRLPAAIHEAVLKQDFDTVVASWKSAQRYADQARSIADRAQQRGKHVADKEAQQILVTAKMWADISQQIENYKKDVWKRLKTSHGVKSPATRKIMRRRLAANDKQDTRLLARYLRSASSGSFGARSKVASRDMDASSVIHFWETVTASLSHLLSPTRGILGEVLDFWTVAQSFIDGKVQKTFPSSVVGSPSAQEHLELDPEEVQNLRAGALELMDLLRESTLAFFADSPPDDISELYSPIPPTPITPDSAATGALSPSQERKRMFNFDLTNLPPPSPKRGDSWEKFAFWPPFSNTLSGSHYLARVIALVGTAAAELASLSVVKQSRTGSENLKTMLGSVRERIVQALCASWTADTERFKYAETWQRSPERRDLTSMPTIDARLFQSYVKPTVDKLDRVVQDGISDPSWAPTGGRPDDARPYVYEVLLTLVLVHSEVSTTASSLTSQVLSHLLTTTSSSLLNAFTHTHPHYTLAALMQATLDVEFLAQTLNNYTTDKAGEIQSQIYLCLDERTDDEARKRLQGELPEMRGVLKRLREGTKGEFGCFRRERRGRAETSKGREGAAGGK
ncbi:hypothetical protein D0862_03679 [Hortaea werneckii]|uniref:Exocyst complex component SEC5 n=1 Tax=Hortaea werneckii TaxID=91943 RepID=A0A3M7H7K3_HORWE|nr:hypothetical protein D0862_03679 [Hortaea werneckii]